MINEMNGKEETNQQVRQLVTERGQGMSPTFEGIEQGQQTKPI